MPEIPDFELAELLAPQRVIEKRRQDGPITLVLEAVAPRRREQFTGLVVTKRRRFAFATLASWPLDALDRVMGDSVLLAQVFEQGGERRQAMPDGTAAELSTSEISAPSDDVG